MFKANDRLTIEPTRGLTYSEDSFTVYAYGEYEKHSVNYGQVRRSYVETFETVEEAQRAFPQAEVSGSGIGLEPSYEPDLDETDHDEYFSREY